MNLTVQHRQHTHTGRFRAGGDTHRLQQVEVRVGSQGGRRPHGAGDYHGLVCFHRQMKEISGLFQGRGSVGHHQTGHLGLLPECPVYPVSQA